MRYLYTALSEKIVETDRDSVGDRMGRSPIWACRNNALQLKQIFCTLYLLKKIYYLIKYMHLDQ